MILISVGAWIIQTFNVNPVIYFNEFNNWKTVHCVVLAEVYSYGLFLYHLTHQRLPVVRGTLVSGMSGAFWGETVRTPEQLHSLIYPRLLALAERAWHKAEWENVTDKTARDKAQAEDWERFSNTLGYKELARLDKQNIKYHLPPPGAM